MTQVVQVPVPEGATIVVNVHVDTYADVLEVLASVPGPMPDAEQLPNGLRIWLKPLIGPFGLRSSLRVYTRGS